MTKTETSYELIESAATGEGCLIVWAHGWSRTREDFRPFVQSLSGRAAHLLLDFPGFGKSPLPTEIWGTEDYAEAMVDILSKHRNFKKIIWVGHSMGGRVGIQLAARHPDLIDGMFLIAGAGLPRKRSLWGKVKYYTRIYTYKTLKNIALVLGMDVEKLRAKFGSADYKSAGLLRPIFLKLVHEDLSDQARQIKCPVSMVYGANDVDAPPDIGERLLKLISGSKLDILPGLDHFTVLTSGRHLVIKRLSDFVEAV